MANDSQLRASEIKDVLLKEIEQYEEVRYHQPSDEMDGSWNFEGMIEDASLGFRTGLVVANADAMPSWLPGDEFEAVREAALNAVSEPSPVSYQPQVRPAFCASSQA